MSLGRHMRELWGMKPALAVALVAAVAAALSVLYSVSFLPPSVGDDSLQLSSASTQVLVDTPSSALVDLSQTTYDLTSLTNRGVLVGSVMASPQVREAIGRRTGIPARRITVSPPLTADQPRPLAGNEHDPSIGDLVASPADPRISVEASPTSPILTVDAEAADPETARRLADAAVSGTRDYLNQVANIENTPAESRVRIVQLGAARAAVVNPGAPAAMAVLAAVAAFIVSCILILAVARIRRGWMEPAEDDREDAGLSSAARAA
ncbi:MAG: hypothetical protein R2700_15840 [Solirubrobacterales bacterium]